MPHISSRFSSACIAFIKQWQGLSLEKYRDRQGNWVIGHGHMLTPDETLTFITPDQAEAFLLDDLNSCDMLLQNCLPELNTRNAYCADVQHRTSAFFIINQYG